MPTIAISGSIAFDTIMMFDGRFRDHILPEEVHRLNVAFLVPGMRREYGGCAANIAYNLRALAAECAIVGAIGDDGLGYRERLQQLGVDMQAVWHEAGSFCAQAFITTDADNHQITAFHPGAMQAAHRAHVPAETRLAIIAPNAKSAMLGHAEQCVARGIPYVFDPGQGLPMFDGAELLALIEPAYAVAVNDYEFEMLQSRTGLSASELIARVPHLIVTRGATGSDIYVNGDCIHIAALPVAQACDPTGCGDAYRAGLLYGMFHAWDWLKTGRLGTVLGAIKVEHQGGQNHRISRDEIAARYQAHYDEPLWDAA